MKVWQLRYKAPDETVSKPIVHTVKDALTPLQNTSGNFRFSAAVAEFGMLLRSSGYIKNGSFQQVASLAKSAIGTDPNGYRSEFLQLVNAAQAITKTMVKNNTSE